MAQDTKILQEEIAEKKGKPIKSTIKQKRTKKKANLVISDVKLSLQDLEEEIDDSALFYGVLAYLKLQKQYLKQSKEEILTLNEFQEKIVEFKKQKIYKKEEVEEVKRL